MISSEYEIIVSRRTCLSRSGPISGGYALPGRAPKTYTDRYLCIHLKAYDYSFVEGIFEQGNAKGVGAAHSISTSKGTTGISTAASISVFRIFLAA